MNTEELIELGWMLIDSVEDWGTMSEDWQAMALRYEELYNQIPFSEDISVNAD